MTISQYCAGNLVEKNQLAITTYNLPANNDRKAAQLEAKFLQFNI